MTAKVSNVYEPVDIEVVRGGVTKPPIKIRALDTNGAPKDMTGRTVVFRATTSGESYVIEKTISAFATIDGVACLIEIVLTEADTRGITYAMTWEAQDDNGVVFAGGKLTAKGGANPDAP